MMMMMMMMTWRHTAVYRYRDKIRVLCMIVRISKKTTGGGKWDDEMMG